ncbi:MAG: LacI family transcriptional regulator [Bacteroidetes bacterium]|nr:LacI family transcriptional regulator [Bacteroidota bacterium]
MAKKQHKIKLDDIARKLNVSKVTVSKALRGHPDISAATIELVKKTSQKMGYVPNLTARNLSSNKTNTIGVVVPKVAHFFFGSIVESLYDEAFKNDYELILTVSQENAERERKHIETLLSMNVDGLIIAISNETKNYDIFKTVERHDVPVIFIDRIPDLPNINKIVVSDKEGTFDAIEHAINLGYTKIAYFSSYTNINIGRERLAGYKKAMKKEKLSLNPEWILQGGFREEFGYESFMKLYDKKILPELIFTETYPVALGVYEAARKLKMNIPRDIDVICFGNADVQKYLNPPLSCVNQPTEIIAKKAIEMILEEIDSKDKLLRREVVISTELLLRGTCVNKNKGKRNDN